jgi:formate hydrogenlyase subunit 3/multisubunit Na+/H+ antiporter MnhD subunit
VSLIFAPLLVLWPAALVLAVADGRRRAAGFAAVAALAVAFALLAVLLARVAADGPQDLLVGGWAADVGIRLRADALGPCSRCSAAAWCSRRCCRRW